MNPLELQGPVFLQLYLVLLVLSVFIAVPLRWWMRLPAEPAPKLESARFDPYEVAYLAGGQRPSVQAALASLVHAGALDVKSDEAVVHRTNLEVSGTHPLEQSIYSKVDPKDGRTIAEVHADAEPVIAKIQARLEQFELVLTADRSLMARFWPAVCIGAVTLLGVLKLLVGVSRDRPVGFLFALCLISAGLAALFLRRPHRTRAGDAVLRRLQEQNSALNYQSASNPEGLSREDLVMAVALFGTSAMAGGMFAHLRAALQAPKEAGGACSVWTSSCGGSSCGGGCGGGCGGCGGCGG